MYSLICISVSQILILEDEILSNQNFIKYKMEPYEVTSNLTLRNFQSTILRKNLTFCSNFDVLEENITTGRKR